MYILFSFVPSEDSAGGRDRVWTRIGSFRFDGMGEWEPKLERPAGSTIPRSRSAKVLIPFVRSNWYLICN